MSRKQWKFSDFDKYLKPMHLAGKQHTLTVTHIGVEPVKSRQREYVIAGDAPEEHGDEYLLVLHFREFQKPLRVNNMNRAKLTEVIGDDPASLIGCKVTIRAVTLKQFGGQEAIDIVSVEKPKAAPVETVPVGRPALLKKLSELRQKEKDLLSAAHFDQTPLTAEQVKEMPDEAIEELIERTALQIDDLKAAKA